MRLYGQAGYPTQAGYLTYLGLPPPCNQALNVTLDFLGKGVRSKGRKKFPLFSNTHKDYPDFNPVVFNSCEHVFLTFCICLVFRLPRHFA